MTYITHHLMDNDNSLLLHPEGKWGDKSLVSPLEAESGEYTSFNDAGVETETGEFLYAMVRILKPEHVLETGTHVGVGASYLAKGLSDNKKGHLDTLEFISELRERAMRRFSELKLDGLITSHLCDAASFLPSVRYDLVLLDTEPQTRFSELVRFYDFIKPGGYVFIHDLHRHMHQIPNEEHGFAWPYGKIPEAIKKWVETGSLRPFHFPTPRGLTGFYKTHEDDYVWWKTGVNV